MVQMAPMLGNLARLPREVRDMIYRYIVVGTGQHAWGQRSGLETAIIRTNSTVAEEAIEQMYNTKMLIAIDPHTCSDCPPACGLSRMVHINLEVSFETENRGDSEMSIHDAGKLKAITEYIALSLRRSRYLRTLDIVLLNEAQRKRGSTRRRSDLVVETIRAMLKPFAALPKHAKILISGFDTLQYLEMFDKMRGELAGSDISVEYLCEV